MGFFNRGLPQLQVLELSDCPRLRKIALPSSLEVLDLSHSPWPQMNARQHPMQRLDLRASTMTEKQLEGLSQIFPQLKHLSLQPFSAYLCAIRSYCQGQKVTQQQLYVKAIELNPTQANAYNTLGVTLPTGGKVQLLNGTEMTQQQLYANARELLM